MQKEFAKARYLGPYSQAEIESTLGPFQTAPMSIVPKPGKPGKFRLIQNLSFPHSNLPVPSINSLTNPNNFPSPYSTFEIVSLVLSSLPPGSQGAIRDVAEAYCTVPLHPSQWHALVVRLSESHFAVDTSLCFGFGPSGGIYGSIGSAGTDIMRHAGIGPILRWVDDHLFIRIPITALNQYNKTRLETAQQIRVTGQPSVNGGRCFFTGSTLPDGRTEEYDEDCSSPLRNLSTQSLRPPTDRAFCYNLDDVDRISAELGIPWEPSKDIPFCDAPTFIGFVWDLSKRTVQLTDSKRAKYIDALSAWTLRRTHTLDDVQSILGKLMHVCQIYPDGRPYLVNLEAMPVVPIFGNTPYMPRTPPQGTPDDIKWWLYRLTFPPPPPAIPSPQPILDPLAYSDASTSFGIGISLNGQWRAWRLLPPWRGSRRDIGWAESVGFELLILSTLHTGASGVHFQVFGDNQGIVEAWRRGRSRNRPTNEVFKRIHAALDHSHCAVHTRYVPSADNPADPLSRRIYPPMDLLIPAFPISEQLRPFIVNVTTNPDERLVGRQ